MPWPRGVHTWRVLYLLHCMKQTLMASTPDGWIVPITISPDLTASGQEPVMYEPAFKSSCWGDQTNTGGTGQFNKLCVCVG